MAGRLLIMRRLLRRNRVFRDRRNPLDSFDDIELYAAFRFYRHEIFVMIDELTPYLEHVPRRRGSLPPSLQLMLALRFYATGSFQSTLAELIGIGQATASRTIARVTNGIVRQLHLWVKFPTQQEANVQKLKFHAKAGFPNVFGCIDCTHVRIQAPTRNEHEYVNRKNYHSINVQIVCDADLKIINCVAKWPGSVHDARILRDSSLFTAFESPQKPITGLILGDSGYMLRDWLMTPILNTRNQHDERYNESLCATRCTVERCIGVLKRRFHCLHTELRVAPHKVCRIVTACIILHNRARTWHANDDTDQPDDENNEQAEGSLPSEGASGVTLTEHAKLAAGKAVRDNIIRNNFTR